MQTSDCNLIEYDRLFIHSALSKKYDRVSFLYASEVITLYLGHDNSDIVSGCEISSVSSFALD